MGNRIFDISGTEQQTTPAKSDGILANEKYVDVGMDSEKKVIYQKGSAAATEKTCIARDVNVKAIMNSVRNIFSWSPGERILNPEFGQSIDRYLYEGITEFNVEQIMSEIRSISSRWEPRIQIQRVVNISTPMQVEENTVELRIIFTIPSISDEQYQYSFTYRRTD
jgi:phage baseplate assembly protein W